MAKNHSYDTAEEVETAVLVGIISGRQTEEQSKEYLAELAFLAGTAGVKTLKTFTQKLAQPHHRTFVGKGKLDDIKAYVKSKEIDIVIFDDELSPSQTRNLEKELEVKILDRSILILQIFMIRAKTSQALAQVKLAQYEYMLPRLTRMWTHHSRQAGGIGMRGGPGETELETDRRIVRDQITNLRKQLDKIEKQAAVRRKSRDRKVRVALCGYTNVGKSTLMRLLSKSDVFAENKLFATVDSTVRKIVWDQIPFLLTDTVGFIRKLPTNLIESFKSTLAEIIEADILMHVVDVSHESYEEQIEVVDRTLTEIGVFDRPTILVFNKIDAFRNPDADDPNAPPSLEELRKTHMSHRPGAVFISATEKDNVKELREMLIREVKKAHVGIFPNSLESY